MSQENLTKDEDLEVTGGKRRGLLAGAGLSALAVGALVTGAAGLSSGAANAQGVTDADIFNFALNLEYLEAEYYLRGVTGQGLAASDTTGTGSLGGVVGGSAVPFRSSYLQQYMTKIAIDEQAHVRFIRTVLGSAAVARPVINLADSFTVLAIAAGLIVPAKPSIPSRTRFRSCSGLHIRGCGRQPPMVRGQSDRRRNLWPMPPRCWRREAYLRVSVRTLIANIGAVKLAAKITTHAAARRVATMSGDPAAP
jgi:hypothetical protein